MAYPQDEGQYILDTDASAYAIGAVLSQMQKNEQGKEEEKVIAYASRVLQPRETRYCVRRREMLAIVHFVKHFRPYLWGRKVLIRTDHASLKYVKTMKEPSDQFHRWLERLEELEYTIEVRKGVNHGNADGLSRLGCEGKRCICVSVKKMEMEDDSSDDHEVIYARQSELVDDEKYLEVPEDDQLQQMPINAIEPRRRKHKAGRKVNFQNAARGETDSDDETVPAPTTDTDVSGQSAEESSEKMIRAVQMGRLWTRQDMIDAQLDDDDISPVYHDKVQRRDRKSVV